MDAGDDCRDVLRNEKGYSMPKQVSYAQWSLEPYCIGLKLRSLRTQKRLTLSRLAAETGLSTALLSKLETDRMIPTLPTLATIKNLNILQDLFTDIMAQHGHKDKSKKTYEWDDIAKKKLQIEEIVEPHLSYFKSLPEMYDQITFLMTYHTVMNDGDIHCLMTGINNAGKSNTAISMLQRSNWFYRNYWHVNSNDETKTPLPEFDLETDVIYLPLENSLDMLLGDTQYKTIDLNEGMMFANNLQSMDKRVIKAGATAYVAKSHHPMIFYEYQVSKRPPAMLMERFNMWIHKVSKKWGVLSMASGIFRKTDPYFMTEIDKKLRTDEEFNEWFRYKNPNFVAAFKTPKLAPVDERAFKRYQKEAHSVQQSANEVRTVVKDEYMIIVRDIWERVNTKNEMAVVDIEPTLMNDYGYSKHDVGLFLKDYWRYGMVQKRRPKVVIESTSQ